MPPTETSKTDEASLTRDLLYAARYYARYYLGGRRGLFALGGAALVAGLAFNWSWLVAVGAAPLILGIGPCLVMCALGLCMNKVAGRSCSSESSDSQIDARSTASRLKIIEAEKPEPMPKQSLPQETPEINSEKPQNLNQRRD
jgi:hypothetical protein